MRRLVLPLLLFPGLVRAQPGPPSFCFVLAEDHHALKPLERSVTLRQQYREHVPCVGYLGPYLSESATVPVQGRPLLSDTSQHWMVYMPREGMAESKVYVSSGTDTMIIDLPERPNVLWELSMERADGSDSPEVVRFRKGTHIIERVVTDPWAVRAARVLYAQKKKEEETAYRRLVAHKEVRRVAQARARELAVEDIRARERATARYERVRRAAHEEGMRGIAHRPALRKAVIDRISADSLWLRISGGVMLDGGWAGRTPLSGLEMLTETGWVEHVPVPDIQMDCGLPWFEWKGEVVGLPPLRRWASTRSRDRTGLSPGTYRVVLMGADTGTMRKEAFDMR
jgi:hypothetical protein